MSNQDIQDTSSENSDAVIRGIIAGKLMRHRIKVVAGDKVQVEMTPYDLTKGRIVYRSK